MNKEQYVTFEVAKLLKEKGFDWKVFHFYDENGHLKHREGDCYSLYNWNYPTNDEYGSQYCSAPTQQMACRWLREEHNIHIMPTIGCDVDRIPRIFYGAVIASFNNNRDISYHDPLDENGYNEPEDAVEAALEYVLKNLI